jgi:DNA repair protein RecO (recombination protein O)
MLHATKGIVLHSLKYAETSIIVKIYTELFGIQSYLVRGIRKTGSKVKTGLFQPLTLLDLVVYHREHASLQTIREVRVAIPYQAIPFDIRKSSVAIFINELIYKSIREEEPNSAMFVFLWNSCLDLDSTEESVAGFHLRFAIQLMHPLGIFPQLNHSAQNRYFNLREGLFQSSVPEFPEFLDAAESERLGKYLAADSGNHPTPDLSSGIHTPPPAPSPKREGVAFTYPSAKKDGNEVLETILTYYRLHLPGFKAMKSHHVLHEVFK